MNDIKIQSKINPVIQYEGLVEIYSTDKDGKKHKLTKHNKGDVGLFNFITRALIGESLTKYRPSKLKVYYNSTSGEQEALVQPVSCGTAWNRLKISDDGSIEIIKANGLSNAIQYVFTIVNSNITVAAKKDGNKISKIELLNNDGTGINSKCAEVVIDEKSEDQVLLDTTDNIIIYWRLLFTNSENNI